MQDTLMVKENETLRVEMRMATDDRRWGSVPNPSKVGRLYVHGERTPAYDHPPYGPKGEDEQVDKAWKAYNRAELKVMRRYAQEALELLKADPEVKLAYSRYAGCSCPCSPGFLLKGARGVVLYVEVKPEAKYAEATDEELQFYLRHAAHYAAKGEGDYYLDELQVVEAELERRGLTPAAA